MVKYQEIFDVEITSKQNLSPEEAVAAIVMVAVYANGQPSEEESEEAINIINTQDIFDSYSVDEFQKMIDKITKFLNEEGIGVLFRTAVESIKRTDDLAEISFQAVAEMVLVDQKIDEDEESFLSQLAEALDISEDVAQDMIDELIDEEEEAFS
ncbi:tellurite resistance TerB family protein [Phormidium sp. LEGE 05292]|uniref:tellurite resistance TerB family protein n=1 Tax=[Phormidium] sp. LEGE 05292 TaxID=767427 RepID=UPI0018817043|nr:tellurite resistance TerB family protein [Phormidium sp. LEGE 05292]MBE9227303.1 tellurite resistance TerB family protein [Phormidium sp. LEGE 05292]